MKLKGEKTYYFAIPLQEIHLEQHGLHFTKKFGFCSLYYPSAWQDKEDFLYLVKVYNHFDNDFRKNIDFINTIDLLFGESLYIPFIPTRGEMKWYLIGEKLGERKHNEFPDLRISSVPTNIPPQNRNWFLLKNAGMNEDSWHSNKKDYEELKNIEMGEEMSEVSVKLRMYISILKNEFSKKKLVISIEEWKEILMNILVNEPATKKTAFEDIKNDFLEGFLYDYLGYWENS